MLTKKRVSEMAAEISTWRGGKTIAAELLAEVERQRSARKRAIDVAYAIKRHVSLDEREQFGFDETLDALDDEFEAELQEPEQPSPYS